MALLTVISALALCGAAVYLFISVHDLVQSLNCIIRLLQRLSRAASSLGASAISRLPAELIDAMRQALPYLDFAAMGPALISMVFLIAAALFGFGFSGEPRSLCCAKCFVVLADIALTLTFGWYLALTAAAFLVDRPVLADQWASFSAVCSTSMPELQTAVDEGRASVDSMAAYATPGQIATAQARLDTASAQLSDFVALCNCLSQVPPQVFQLRGPGLAGLLTTLLAYVAVNSFCCASGCCGRPGRPRVAPGGTEMGKKPPKPGEEDDYSDYDDDYDDDLVVN